MLICIGVAMELLELGAIKKIHTSKCFVGACIYFLFNNGELIYIGCSMNFVGRIGYHATGKGRMYFDEYSVVRVPEGMTPVNLERAYIERYKPKLNSVPWWEVQLDESGNSALDRAMMRIDAGETAISAAKAENLTIGAVRGRQARDRKQDEEDKLLLPSIYVGPAQASFRANRNANLGVHPTSGRGGAKKGRPVKKKESIRVWIARTQREEKQRRKAEKLAEKARLNDQQPELQF